MLKRILIFVLIAAMLSLASCKVVEVIDHGTTAPEETTAPQKQYEPWGFWCSNETLSAIQLTEGSNKATIYSLTPGYYEYDSATETDCTYDGNATFTIVAESETFTFTFDKYANTLSMSDATFVHVDAAPTEHPKFAFPDYEKLAPGTVTVGDIDYASLAATVLEGARYEIATAFYGDMKYFSKLESISRPVQSGDVVNINYCGKLDGVAFEGGTAMGVTLFVSDYKNGYIPGFTDGIIGKFVGETFDVPVTFPEEYHAPDLAGKAVIFTMTLNSICDLSLTDAQVVEYTENDHTTYAEWLDAAKADVAKTLLYDVILEASTAVKLPEESYFYFYQQIIDYYHVMAYYYGIDYEMLALYYGLTEEAMMQQALNEATYNMALYFLAKENELAWTEDDYAAKYEEYVANYLETYKEATREEACKYADEFILQMKFELTEEMVLTWAMTQIFPVVTE